MTLQDLNEDEEINLCIHEWFIEDQLTEYSLFCICKNCGKETQFVRKE